MEKKREKNENKNLRSVELFSYLLLIMQMLKMKDQKLNELLFQFDSHQKLLLKVIKSG